MVAAVRAGDDRAFEQLYERYRRRIAAYIYGMVKDYGRAEEIAQDVFVSALRRIRNSDCDITFKPWIYEIAKNACIDQFRRGRRAELVSYDADTGLGETDRGRLVTTAPSPDAAVDQKLSLDHLRGAFGGLSEAHHDILVMRELEGLSYREIGERLGMSRASVESTLFRARKRLSEEYEELVSGERCVRVQAIISESSARSLGARDQRRMARHVSYCQPCRRHAAMAGLDVAAMTAKPALGTKIAAILPLPAFLRRRWDLPGDGQAVAQLAQVAPTMDPAGMANWAKAVVAAATVAIAGVGANVANEKLKSDPAPSGQGPSVTRQSEQRGSGTAAGERNSATRAAGTQAPAVGAEGSPVAGEDLGDPAGGPVVKSPTRKSTGGVAPNESFTRPDGSTTVPGAGDVPRPVVSPRDPASLTDSPTTLLGPAAGWFPSAKSEDSRANGESSGGPIATLLENTQSTLFGGFGTPSQPSTGTEPGATAPTQGAGLSSLFPSSAGSAQTQSSGGVEKLVDSVQGVVGSLAAP